MRIYPGFSMSSPNAKDKLRKKSFSTSRRPIFFIRSSSVYGFFRSAFRSEPLANVLYMNSPQAAGY